MASTAGTSTRTGVEIRYGITTTDTQHTPPILPQIDETWTKADLRRLVKLLRKRAKIHHDLCLLEVQNWAIHINLAAQISHSLLPSISIKDDLES